MALGPETKRVLEKSKRLDGNNPRVVLIDGMNDYYTPAVFGGDKQRAISKMEHALELFAKEEIHDSLQPSWGYDEACAHLGIMRQETGDLEGAREAFVKALEINPNNGWVKSQLLPGLDS